jgi:lysozyme
MDVITLAKQSLKKHEGYRQFAYQCGAGKTTVAIGRNLDDRGISEREAEYLLENDIVECLQDLSTFPYWNSLNDSQRAALIDLRFCLGAAGYRQFKRMGEALLAGKYEQAAIEIMHSKFADQTGNRATDLAKMLIQ